MTVDGLQHSSIAHALQGVCDGSNGNSAVESLAQWSEHALDHGMIEQGSRRVMNEHHERLLGHLGESGGDRFGSSGASGDTGDDLQRRELFGEQDRRLLPARRRGDDDRVDKLATIEAVEALGKKRPSAESGERLRTIDTEPLTGAGGRDQRPDTSACGGNV